MRDLINAGTAPYANAGTHFRLTANINLQSYSAGEGWERIGFNGREFKGVFDGNGNTIQNLTMNRTSGAETGFFGVILGGTVRNLNLTGVSITANGHFTGGIAGNNNGGTIINCSVQGAITNNIARTNTGGVAGRNTSTATIANCFVNVNITGDTNVGGIAGQNDGVIRNCYTVGSLINSSGNNVGGIAGDNFGSVTNCYSTIHTILGTAHVGGIVGRNDAAASITGCVALNNSVSRVSGSALAFGCIAGNSAGTFTGNVALENMSFPSGSVGNHGGIVTTAQAKTQATYSGSPRSWGFGTTDTNPWRWGLNAAYPLPTLHWQTTAPTLPTHLQ